MKLTTSEQMRDIDRRTITEHQVPGEELMERAGMGVVRCVEYLLELRRAGRPTVVLFAGKGNNGGDAFVVARALCERGVAVKLFIAGQITEIKGDARTHLDRMLLVGVSTRELPSVDEWVDSCFSGLKPDVVVDGILGTGTVGAARGVCAEAIRRVNALSERSLVVAIDIPSGLDSDTGDIAGDVVAADVTVTMGVPKVGLVSGRAVECVGVVEVVDIGVPDTLLETVSSDRELIVREELRSLVRPRPRTGHKGTFGRVLLIGGASGYAGAIVLAARAAVRSGVGLVSVLVPESVVSVVATAVPEAMVHAVAATPCGSIKSDGLIAYAKLIADSSTVLVGPGMTTHAESAAVVAYILANRCGPVVLDADALNVCSDLSCIGSAQCSVMLTPHPGEMARLMNCSVGEVQAHRCGIAARCAEDCEAVVILKGAHSIVVDHEHGLHINTTGNAGMATGGTGDVLAGLVAGLSAQGHSLFESGLIGVYLHGAAGDRAAWSSSQAGVTASDVIDHLPFVHRQIMSR